MSVNSRRPRQSKAMPSKDITRAANALIADRDHCPGCDMVAPWLGGKHGQHCQPLRKMVREQDARDSRAPAALARLMHIEY